jgi:hypothetical protein
MIKKGDPVKVRLSSGEVVDAVYVFDEGAYTDGCKSHWVDIRGELYLANKYTNAHYKCRFVGPPAAMSWPENFNGHPCIYHPARMPAIRGAV